MKKFFTTGFACTALAFGVLGLTGCNKTGAPGTTKTTASAEKTSFKEVTSQLDPGGSFYLYLGTEQILDGLSGKLSGWRELVTALPDVQDKRERINRAFDVVTQVIKDSGVEDISGLGISSIASEPGFYHTKTFVHHYSGKGTGFGWTMFGQKPHELAMLDLLPSNTAMAMSSDMDVPLLWSVIQKEGAQSGIPQAEQALNQFVSKFEHSTGLKWNDVLASLGGEYAMVLTLDEAKMVSIPMPGQQLQIPEPGLMLVARVNNDTVFNRIDAALQKTGQPVIRVDKDKVKMRTVAIPLPLPIELRPTVASSEGYLIIATSDALVQEALAVKSGQKPGLKSTDEFKHLNTDIPTMGNQFCFVSQRFSQTVMQIQKETLQNGTRSNPARKQLLEAFLQPGKAGFAYSVSANTDEGWLTIGNGNQEPAKAILMTAVALPAGLMAAIAVPNFVKARQTSQKNACINNLRQIDGAKQQWALEHNKKASDIPTQADLQPYLGRGSRGSWPVCPQGGHYTIGPVDQMPTCSIPGHNLND